MPPTKQAPTEAPPLSMLCVTAPPDIWEETEFVVRVGRGARRRVAPGDHVDPGSPVVAAFPSCFRPSGERPDVVVVAAPTEDAHRRQQAEAARLQARPAEVRVMQCENCGERSAESPPIPPEPDARDANDLMQRATDSGEPDAHRRARWRISEAWRQHRDGTRAWEKLRDEFLLTHTVCDPARELTPAAEPPEVDATTAPSWWTGPVSSRQNWPALSGVKC
jgi:hypothetical protein